MQRILLLACMLGASQAQDRDALANLLLATNPSPASSMARASTPQMALKERIEAKVPVYSADGTQTGEKALALKIAESGPYIIQKKVVHDRANLRGWSSAHAKTRGEVRGGGRKPYQQKGTGRARRGSSRSPLISRGGGKSHGPRPRDYSISMNKKEKKLAMSTALMNAAPMSIIVPDLEKQFTSYKTKVMADFLKKVGVKEDEKVYMMLEKKHPETFISGKNIPNLFMAHVGPGDGVDMLKLLQSKKIIYSEEAFNTIQDRYSFDKPMSLWRIPAA